HFPVLLKAAAWSPMQLGSVVMDLLPVLMAPTSLIPVFHTLLDLPAMAVFLEEDERQRCSEAEASSTTAAGPEAKPMPAEAAPELQAVLALMDGAYMGTLQGETGESFMEIAKVQEANRVVVDAFKKELLRNENNVPLGEGLDGIVEKVTSGLDGIEAKVISDADGIDKVAVWMACGKSDQRSGWQ
ncbi:hypothetical protein CYMTET_31786, partial [Cymbomonas tetramitiformis]